MGVAMKKLDKKLDGPRPAWMADRSLLPRVPVHRLVADYEPPVQRETPVIAPRVLRRVTKGQRGPLANEATIRAEVLAPLVAAAAREAGVDAVAVLGRSRRTPLVRARHAVMRGLRARGYSLPEIGRLLGLNHTTVLSGLRASARRGS